jgi:hypothetical protein
MEAPRNSTCLGNVSNPQEVSMRKLECVTAVALVATLYAAAPASAQTVDDVVNEVVGLVDANKDGEVTLEETRTVLVRYMDSLREAGDDQARVDQLSQEYAYALQPVQFLQADSNDDMKCTRDELVALVSALSQGETVAIAESDCEVLANETVELEWEWLIENSDADADGQLSAGEWLSSTPTALIFLYPGTGYRSAGAPIHRRKLFRSPVATISDRGIEWISVPIW